MNDTFKTIIGKSEGIFKDRGSKFLAFAHNVSSEDEIKEILVSYKKRFHDARHHCYAWQIGTNELKFRSFDDGEPSGTAGKPILNQIQSAELTNIIIVVIRYFGGVLLGTGGLINAYRSAAADALSKAVKEERTILEKWKISFRYELINDVMRIIKEENLQHENQIFDSECSLTLITRRSFSERVRLRLSRLDSLKIEKSA
jgi:uncharacterized YigZ family protein